LPIIKYLSASNDNRIEGASRYRATNDNAVCSTEPLHYVKEIPLTIARPFIEKWHYSKKVPTGKNIFFGWYITDFAGTAILYAVADYGIGVNPNLAKYLTRLTGKNVSQSNLFELKRLCRTDPMNSDFPLTLFLSLCHKTLKRDYGIRFIVSFSDPEHNRFTSQKDVPYNSGGIYKAANFEYLGKTNAEMHVIDEQGVTHHRKYAYSYMKRQNERGNPIKLNEARKILGVTPIRTEPKDRWLLDLGKNGKSRAIAARRCGAAETDVGLSRRDSP
jgi:hypothetical protein